MPSSGGDAPSAGAAAPMPSGAACDLSGRWLITQHAVADGLGQLQTVHTWIYAEIDQRGDAFTVTKGMECGDDVVARTDLGGNADFHKAWDAIARKVSFAGRKGTSMTASSGCKVHFDKFYTLKGASTPYYTDPSIPIPTIDQPAMGSTPGWEDWDQDGQPGVTGVISGLLTGKIFIASRTWSELSGTGDPSSVLRLDLQWGEETNILAYDGSPLLETQAVRAADASLHFAQLVRLADGEATGADDLATCAAVRKLAPMLTPEAAGI
jgi:hypothetical protein